MSTEQPVNGSQPGEAEFMGIVHRLDGLVQAFESHPSAEVRDSVMELLQAVDALHRAGLARLVHFFKHQGYSDLIDQAAADPVVRTLLVLYDLVPPDPRLQVEMILEDARAYIQSHGGDMEILNVEGGTVHLRLLGACQDCPASAATLQQNIRAALEGSFPGFEEIVLHAAAQGPAAEAPAKEQDM